MEVWRLMIEDGDFVIEMVRWRWRYGGGETEVLQAHILTENTARDSTPPPLICFMAGFINIIKGRWLAGRSSFGIIVNVATAPAVVAFYTDKQAGFIA